MGGTGVPLFSGPCNLCVGSAIQVALLVSPLLVLGSWLMGQPMSLVFRNPLA